MEGVLEIKRGDVAWSVQSWALPEPPSEVFSSSNQHQASFTITCMVMYRGSEAESRQGLQERAHNEYSSKKAQGYRRG